MGWSEVTDIAALTALLGTPTAAVATKERRTLHALDRDWLAASPFCVMATADAAGRCDVSPKGDSAGDLVHVIDDHTLAIAERPGNRRADGYRNILVNPHVGLNFFIPGRGDTLRINGRARLVSEASFFDRLVVKGHRPLLAVVVEVEQIYHHCAKAFLRSGLWKPETWHPTVVPSTAVLAKTLLRTDEDLATLEAYYGPSYAEKLYG